MKNIMLKLLKFPESAPPPTSFYNLLLLDNEHAIVQTVGAIRPLLFRYTLAYYSSNKEIVFMGHLLGRKNLKDDSPSFDHFSNIMTLHIVLNSSP
jgi:hypothetical protein